MKTAVFYSGQARTFASCFQNQYWYILRHLHDPHFFVSVADDPEAKAMALLRNRFRNVTIEIVKQPDFPEAQALADKHSAYSGYILTASPQNIMRAFWSYKQAWNLCKDPDEFGTFVRIRPDIWFKEYNAPHFGHVWNMSKRRDLCFSPAWGSYGGVNDRFAVLGGCAAEQWFTAIDRIAALLGAGCPFHPETLTAAALGEDCWIKPELITDFRIRRMASQPHPQLNPNRDREWEVPEPILGIELLRAALRY